MADIREYTIDGDDLEQLLSELAEGGYTSTPAYKLTVRIYPAARKVSFNVNDGGFGMPCGELTHAIHA
jgi:K+-sensing histidine kinase KdpD